MNYNNLFKKVNEEDKKELPSNVHNEMLRQLFFYAMEDKEQDFIKLLNNKDYNLYFLSTNFSFDKEYDLDGVGNETSIYSYDNYSSFLNLAISCFKDKYINKIIDFITEKDIEKTREHYPQDTTTELIRDCILYGKYDILNKLKEKKLVNDIAILQTIYVYEKHTLEKCMTDEMKTSAENMHRVINTLQASNYKKTNKEFLAENQKNNNNYELMPPNNGSFLINNRYMNGISYNLVRALRECNLMGYEKRDEIYQDTLRLIRTELNLHNSKKQIDSFQQNASEFGNIKEIFTEFVVNGQLDFDSIITVEDLPILKKNVTIKELCQYRKEEEESICAKRFEKMYIYLDKTESKDKEIKITKKIKV